MLNRDDALKICETRAGAREGGGRGGRDRFAAEHRSSRTRALPTTASRPAAAPRISTITATVWVGRRRGAVDRQRRRAPAALKQLADEAVQIARVSPVHREYVPTLGPLDLSASDRGFAAATANIDLDARAKTLDARARPPAAPRRSPAPASTRASAVATAAATANGNRRYFRSTDADFSVTARSADGTGSGYFSGDHFDLAKLDAQHVVDQAVSKAVQLAAAEADRAGRLPRHPRAAGGRGLSAS